MSGLETERELSIEFHRDCLPILVSSSLLRSRTLGQLDLVRMIKDTEGYLIEIGEVKSSLVGEEMLIRGQRKRLYAAQNFLSSLLGRRSKLTHLLK